MNFITWRHWRTFFVIVISVWVIVLIITIYPVFKSYNFKTENNERLETLIENLEIVRKQNVQLRRLLGDTNVKDDQFDKLVPNILYEKQRRQIALNVEEIGNFYQSELTNLRKELLNSTPELVDTVNYIINLGLEHKRALSKSINKLTEVDGFTLWRTETSIYLSNLVQRRLDYIQNPTNCKKAKKLICNLNKSCGFGCQLHHAVYCLITAYSTERTLILQSHNWQYDSAGWEDVFLPLSDTCRNSTNEPDNWPGNEDTLEIQLPIIDKVEPIPNHLPLTIPEDLACSLIRFHGDPSVWWIGQFVKYLLRPQEETETFLQNFMDNIQFKGPIVGIQIRRTDKLETEAAYHSLQEYMDAVDEYYTQLELTQYVQKRRVYVASDDETVIADLKQMYSHYEILGDPEISKTAENDRYTKKSLIGLIADIYTLSKCDYLVCTFSSQVCRMAYELMQSHHPDASNRFTSLDDIYYFGGQFKHHKVAILAHKPRNQQEIELRPGDLIEYDGNHWNGYSQGVNIRTLKRGIFPTFKVEEDLRIIKYPTYSNVSY